MMEAEKSHDVPPTGWRPRKASGVTHSVPKGLRTNSVKQEKIDAPIQANRQEGMDSSFFCLFLLFGPKQTG